MYTMEEIENGCGRLCVGRTTILQDGNKNLFETQSDEAGWAINMGSDWHVAGSATPSGPVVWIDLR